MKNDQTYNDKGSVLVIALMTMTILTMICATSLYITSQNTSAGMQTAAWQQALTGAEAGIDAAVRALNQTGTSGANAWTNWKTVNSTLPTPAPSSSPVLGYTYEPTGGNAVGSGSPPPDTSHYYYLPSANLSISYPNTEGTTAVKAWVTIDTWSSLSNSNGSWYRVRATGQATFQSNSVYKRVSNNRLDNDLRNTITMNLNRKGGNSLGPTRTIEAILQPVPKGGSARAITLANWLQMTGGGSVDAFSSPNGQWSSTYRDASNPMLVAEGATGNQAKFANTGQTYVYGGVTYSGTPPTNINAGGPPKDVMGQVSTPAVVSLPPPSDPTAVSGQSGHYTWTYQSPWSGTTANYTFNSSTTYSGAGAVPTAITANGTASSPGLVIINGDFTVSGGQTFAINATTTGSPPVANSSNSNVIIWVKGKFTTSGSGMITQASGTNVTWIVDGDITVSGSSYSNQNGTAATDSFVGIGNNKFTDSGSGNFVGTVNAPGYDGTISGSGDYTGGFAGSTLTISGSGSFHYDEGLSPSSNPAIGNYAYASWFEDNSDPTHKDMKGNYVVY
ncbi:MAG TPA: pilus assembly PilX N-terminal domain-containing protein [Chthoniobacterales bacterium]|nr:pilus assembly PilX N-terminal domain-containing protein [Chthoniobacterales bacterium]